MTDTIGRYVEAGVDQINLALRAPWEHDLLETLGETIARM